MKASELLRNHSSKDYYKTAITRVDEFLKVMIGQQSNIRHRIDQSLSDDARNRQKLKNIVSTVLLCGRLNIPIRKHIDSFSDM